MTTSTDGTTCDACGANLGNGGIDRSVVLSALVEPGNVVVNLHLCTFTGQIPGADGPEALCCASRILSGALTHYTQDDGGSVAWWSNVPMLQAAES